MEQRTREHRRRERSERKRRSTWAGPLAFFGLALLIYNLNQRQLGALDSVPARLLPIALLTGGTLYLDPLETLLPHEPELSYWYTRTSNGRVVSMYPLVVPLLVTPFFIPVALSADGFTGFDDARLVWMEKVSASILAALSVALVFVLLRGAAQPWTAVVLTVAYAFGTQTWVTSSQALWSHGVSEMLLVALLLLLLRRGRGPALLAGLCAGLLVVNRPPTLPFALAALVYVFVRRRFDATAFVVSALLIGAAALAYNLALFGNPLGGYQHLAQPRYFQTPADSSYVEALAGLLVSPARGLLLFAPFFAFLPASFSARAAPDRAGLLRFFLPAAGVQLLFFGAFAGWAGGVCYGPRLLTDMMPVLILALVPAIDRLRGWGWRAVFLASVGFAIAVQAVGAFCFPLGGSNTVVERWDYRNPQFLLELRGGSAVPWTRVLFAGSARSREAR